MMEKKTVLLSSVARNDFALRKSLQLFGAMKVYVFHTPIDAIDDGQMKIDITRNIAKIREFYTVEEIVIDMYDFYNNVKIASGIIERHPKDRLIIDVTGGDRAVAFALVYATLLANRNSDAMLVYFKRPEHVDIDPSYIPLPHLPTLTGREMEFMERMEMETTSDNMMDALGTSKSYTWNLINSLSKKGLISVDKSSGVITCKFPGNIYARHEEK